MKLLKTIFLLLSLCLISLYTEAQGRKFSFSGRVTEKESGESVMMANVLIEENGLWAMTDDKGAFKISGISPGSYTIVVSELGYQSVRFQLKINADIKDYRIGLEVESLSLEEVVVTAKEGGQMSSASKISKQTIEHVQPSSLADVMQLLPGSVTSNPDLTTAATLSIRDITGTSTANSAGTALIVDGAGFSNDANLQMLSSSSAINAGDNNTASTAGGGVDVRSITTDNIESVEVIRGIPSVIYGDLTSGAVVVKTKAGATPWEIRLKADPKLKQVSFGKGLKMGEKAGMLNFDADYAHAYSDVRSPASAYNRINFQVGYSNTFAGKVTFNAKLRGNWSKASNGSDPDAARLNELQEELDRGLRLNINGRWIINRPWITNFEYMLTGSINGQYAREKTYQGSAGYTPTSSSKTDTEAKGFFTPAQYYSDVNIYGTPVDAQGRITANQVGLYLNERINNRVLLGLEWKMNGNSGRGKVFDPLCPPSPGSAAAYRERSFKDIPYLHRLTAFVEDNFKFSFSGMALELQAGVRFNSIFASGINTNPFSCWEPRFNGRFVFIERKEGFRHLSIRGGWGMAYKMPSMIYLYPEDAYKDLVSFNYNDFDATNYGLAVITTKCTPTGNLSLKPQSSRNIEAGIEWESDWVSGSVVYFNEKMRDGYGFSSRYMPVTYKRYGYTMNPDGSLSQTLVPSAAYPIYNGSSVSVGGRALPSVTDTTFMYYSVPTNSISMDKWGVEFNMDFPQIKPIRTTISVSGAYMNIRQNNNDEVHFHYSKIDGGRSYPYVAIYGGSTSTATGSVRDKLSANIRVVTHIPRIAMVVTLTAQLVFIDRSRQICEYNGSSLPYYYDENGARISGAEALADTRHTKYVNPLSLMDQSGNIIPFTREMEKDPAYTALVKTTNVNTFYLEGGYPFYGMLNIRISKEIKKIATISFYANNFLNLRGRVNHSVTGYPNDRNTPIYFGAEVKISIR